MRPDITLSIKKAGILPSRYTMQDGLNFPPTLYNIIFITVISFWPSLRPLLLEMPPKFGLSPAVVHNDVKNLGILSKSSLSFDKFLLLFCPISTNWGKWQSSNLFSPKRIEIIHYSCFYHISTQLFWLLICRFCPISSLSPSPSSKKKKKNHQLIFFFFFFLTGTRKKDHLSPDASLHWLSERFKIRFKILLSSFLTQCMVSLNSKFSTSLIPVLLWDHSGSWRQPLLVIPSPSGLSIVAPGLWNPLSILGLFSFCWYF